MAEKQFEECPNCDASQGFAREQGIQVVSGKCWQCGYEAVPQGEPPAPVQAQIGICALVEGEPSAREWRRKEMNLLTADNEDVERLAAESGVGWWSDAEVTAYAQQLLSQQAGRPRVHGPLLQALEESEARVREQAVETKKAVLAQRDAEQQVKALEWRLGQMEQALRERDEQPHHLFCSSFRSTPIGSPGCICVVTYLKHIEQLETAEQKMEKALRRCAKAIAAMKQSNETLNPFNRHYVRPWPELMEAGALAEAALPPEEEK